MVARLAGFLSGRWGESNEPWRLFNLEIHWGLGIQVPAFPDNRYSAYEERPTTQIGGVDFPLVWLLISGLRMTLSG